LEHVNKIEEFYCENTYKVNISHNSVLTTLILGQDVSICQSISLVLPQDSDKS